ncbi:MAG TPA: ABC transporter permease [Stellaceae bacterium]|nr:ABC transporter permease [Stellaceae bacterium]
MTRLALYRALLILAAVAVLEILCLTGAIDPLTMQPPHQMAIDLVRLLASGKMNRAILQTVGNAAIACALAVVIGIGFGVVVHRLSAVRDTLDLVFSTYYALPTLAFYPLFIILFGLGPVPQIIMGFLQGVVAVIVSTLDGLDRVPRVLKKLAAAQRMSPLETALKITLPAAAPYLLTGAKLAVAYSIIGVIAAEFLMSQTGIGYQISFAYNNFDNATMYPLILLLVVFSIAVNGTLFRWERRMLRQRGLRA